MTAIPADMQVRHDMRPKANLFAKQFLSLKGVMAVQLFGSLARGEETEESDYDLIIVTTPDPAQRWLDYVNLTLGFNDEDVYHDGPFVRRTALQLVVDTSPFSPFIPNNFDLFVFPTSWQNPHVATMLQHRGGHHDPMFMRNIMGDVITYDPFTGSFPWPD